METFRIVRQNVIYAGWIFRISIACWFLNKTFEVTCIQKSVISLLSMPTLKSPKTMKFSYLDEYKAKRLCMALSGS